MLGTEEMLIICSARSRHFLPLIGRRVLDDWKVCRYVQYSRHYSSARGNKRLIVVGQRYSMLRVVTLIKLSNILFISLGLSACSKVVTLVEEVLLPLPN